MLAQVSAWTVWPWVILALAIVLYFAPTKIAYDRRSPWRLAVFVVNLVFGWTLLGWVVALVMAFRPSRPIADAGGVSRPPTWPAEELTLAELQRLRREAKLPKKVDLSGVGGMDVEDA